MINFDYYTVRHAKLLYCFFFTRALSQVDKKKNFKSTRVWLFEKMAAICIYFNFSWNSSLHSPMPYPVTGMNVYISVCLIFGVCGFYTVLVRSILNVYFCTQNVQNL